MHLPTGYEPFDLHRGAKAGSYLRLIDSCITQLKAQGPSRTCDESKEEQEKGGQGITRATVRECQCRPAVQRPGRNQRAVPRRARI